MLRLRFAPAQHDRVLATVRSCTANEGGAFQFGGEVYFHHGDAAVTEQKTWGKLCALYASTADVDLGCQIRPKTEMRPTRGNL
jgi:hypothetical protein